MNLKPPTLLALALVVALGSPMSLAEPAAAAPPAAKAAKVVARHYIVVLPRHRSWTLTSDPIPGHKPKEAVFTMWRRATARWLTSLGKGARALVLVYDEDGTQRVTDFVATAKAATALTRVNSRVSKNVWAPNGWDTVDEALKVSGEAKGPVTLLMIGDGNAPHNKKTVDRLEPTVKRLARDRIHFQYVFYTDADEGLGGDFAEVARRTGGSFDVVPFAENLTADTFYRALQKAVGPWKAPSPPTVREKAALGVELTILTRPESQLLQAVTEAMKRRKELIRPFGGSQPVGPWMPAGKFRVNNAFGTNHRRSLFYNLGRTLRSVTNEKVGPVPAKRVLLWVYAGESSRLDGDKPSAAAKVVAAKAKSAKVPICILHVHPAKSPSSNSLALVARESGGKYLEIFGKGKAADSKARAAAVTLCAGP